MSFNFYCFTDLKHVSQPDYSYWCWAACLSKMIYGLKSNSNIGSKQCELVGSYKEYKSLNNWNNHLCTDCCSSSNNIPSGCNIGLRENDLSDLFSQGGFNAQEIALNNLSSFDYIKSILISHQSPIVIKLNNNGNSHMNLINGFGEFNNCQYILLSDPLKNIGETYIEFSHFTYGINKEKVWKTALNSHNLVKDKLLESSIEFIEKFIEEHIANSEDQSLKKIWNYLGHRDPSFIAQGILEISNKREDIGYKEEFLIKLKRDFNEKFLEGNCEQKINKDLVVYTDVNFIHENQLNIENKYKILRGDAQSYIEDYATRINVEIRDEEIWVKPISFPKDYILKSEWQNYYTFLSALHKNPKISYFKTEKRLPPLEGMAIA
ncbi:hypothetical protein [Urechidicola croceus]|uniref:Uncharacterized protein n=1 Tax=Urechidicola croceus TaxID=1850246 RepID=A0A1D8P4P4_9FLAO|nr:hypothetical protein [Urechidicola croceus]AOW19535.1 hypothetical protein LPB138_02060 [Urechidicola croceus]